jgi:hypothetical protein
VPNFSIWKDNQEQWSATDIDPPLAVVVARTAKDAAESYAADANPDNDSNVIVRDETTGNYFRIELVREWTANYVAVITLEELCAP